MPLFTRLIPALLLTLVVPSTTFPTEITVHLHTGKKLTAEVDVRSNDESLWLRFTSPSMVLRRSVPWNHITSAQVGDESLSPEVLKDRVSELASELPEDYFDRPENAGAEDQAIYLPPPRPQRAAGVRAEAWPSNWDSDPEIDGLELAVTAVDSHGHPVPVRGQVVVELVGRNNMPRHNETVYPVWQRWAKPLPHDGSAATLRLPFYRIHPENDPRISTHGMLRVTLNAFGHGSFETETPVFLRDYNPIRDQMLFHPARSRRH